MAFNTKGAATGAVSGASLGTAITPGWGTAIGAAVGGLAGGLFLPEDTGAADSEQLIAQHKAASDAIVKRIQDEWQLPPAQRTPITFQEFKVIGKYAPDIARQIVEQSPQLIQESGSQQEIALQKQALNQYAQLSKAGFDPIQAAQQEKAMGEADFQDRAARNRVLQQYTDAGLGSSGQGFLATMAAGDQASQARREAALQSVAGAEQRRQAALSNMAGLAGNLRQTNLGVEQINTNLINSFNQRNAMNKQAFEQQRANTMNQAQQFNLQNAQDVANRNTLGINQTNQFNTQQQNQAAIDRANSANARLQASTGAGMSALGAQTQMQEGAINAASQRTSAMPQLILQGSQAIAGGIAASKAADNQAALNQILASKQGGASVPSSSYLPSSQQQPNQMPLSSNLDNNSTYPGSDLYTWNNVNKNFSNG